MSTNTISEDPMRRLADATVAMLAAMVQSRVDAGMTDNDEIAESILSSLRRNFLADNA
jgi:hypothetical protein